MPKYQIFQEDEDDQAELFDPLGSPSSNKEGPAYPNSAPLSDNHKLVETLADVSIPGPSNHYPSTYPSSEHSTLNNTSSTSYEATPAENFKETKSYKGEAYSESTSLNLDVEKWFSSNVALKFLYENHYLIIVWILIISQIFLLIVICRSFFFISTVDDVLQAQEKPERWKELMRNLDLESKSYLSLNFTLALLRTCHVIMCYDPKASGFESKCLCFSSVKRSWDAANRTCTQDISNGKGSLALFNTKEQQASLNVILKEFFASQHKEQGYYRPEFWVGARSTDGYTWVWGNNYQSKKTFISDQTLMYDCLALRGDGYLEPKPCWPVYGVDDGGVLCEKKVKKITIPEQNYKANETCEYYGSTEDSLLETCQFFKKKNLTNQVFCDHNEGICYAYLLKHQLRKAGDYYYHSGGYYDSGDSWMSKRKLCIDLLGMPDLVTFNDEDEQEFVLEIIKERLINRDYLSVGSTKFGINNGHTWKWVDAEKEGLDQKLFKWIPGGVIHAGNAAHCLSIELNTDKLNGGYTYYGFEHLYDKSSVYTDIFNPESHNRNEIGWFIFLDSTCTENHNFVCEFNPEDDADSKKIIPLSFIHVLLEKLLMIFCSEELKICYYVPSEKSKQHEAMAACQHALTTEADLSISPVVIYTEAEKKFIAGKIGDLEELLPYHSRGREEVIAVAAGYNSDKKQFEWSWDNNRAINISSIKRYNSYSSNADADPVVAFVGSDGVYSLYAYQPSYYSYYYSYGGQLHYILCSFTRH